MDNRRQKKATWIIISAALVIVITGIVYLSLTAGQSSSKALNDGYDQYRDTLANAKAAYDNGEVLFVDVRSSGEFAASHIVGAVSIPLGEIEGNQPAVDKDALIYTYCT